MPRDTNAARFHCSITVLVTPVNKYGDELSTGQFHYELDLHEQKLSDVMIRLERISNREPDEAIKQKLISSFIEPLFDKPNADVPPGVDESSQEWQDLQRGLMNEE